MTLDVVLQIEKKNMNRLTDVVKNLIIINAIVFFAQFSLGEHFDMTMGYMHFPLSNDFLPFQLVSSMFMHANLGHLLFNMMSLFFLGPTVEQALGGKRFLILYIIAGFVGTFAHAAIDYVQYANLISGIDQNVLADILAGGSVYNTSAENIKELWYTVNSRSLGASGAVYGVVIAFATMFPKQKLMIFPLPFQIPAAIIAVLMVGYGVVSGVGQLSPGIAHFAHLGGALAGFLTIHYWKMANLR